MKSSNSDQFPELMRCRMLKEQLRGEGPELRLEQSFPDCLPPLQTSCPAFWSRLPQLGTLSGKSRAWEQSSSQF